MARLGEYFNSIDTVIEVGTFLHDLTEKLEDRDLKPGEDARELAKVAGLEIPKVLRDTTIRVASTDGKAVGPQVLVALPAAAEKAARIRVKRCWDICQDGPIGIGRVCVKVCVDCSATYGEVRCSITATIIATF